MASTRDGQRCEGEVACTFANAVCPRCRALHLLRACPSRLAHFPRHALRAIQSRESIVEPHPIRRPARQEKPTMKTALLRSAAGVATLAAGLAGAQTYSTTPSYGYAAAPASIVRCESIGSDREFCRVDTRGGVQLHRQLSRTNCIRGRNW